MWRPDRMFFRLYLHTNSFTPWQCSLFVTLTLLFSLQQVLPPRCSKPLSLPSASSHSIVTWFASSRFSDLFSRFFLSIGSFLPSPRHLPLHLVQRVFQGEREGEGTWWLPETPRKAAAGGRPQGWLADVHIPVTSQWISKMWSIVVTPALAFSVWVNTGLFRLDHPGWGYWPGEWRGGLGRWQTQKPWVCHSLCVCVWDRPVCQGELYDCHGHKHLGPFWEACVHASSFHFCSVHDQSWMEGKSLELCHFPHSHFQLLLSLFELWSRLSSRNLSAAMQEAFVSSFKN